MAEKKPSIGIIGGTGKTGGWFARFFEKAGYTVKVASRSTSLTPKEVASASDVVIISVPIADTVPVITELGPLVKKGGLLMDLTSIKKEPVAAMLSCAKSEVIGCHPMFGPGVSSMKGQAVIVCSARSKKWKAWLVKLLKDAGANLQEATPEEHDRMMAVIQGMMHFSSIAFCHALKELDVNINEAMRFTSPVFQLSLYMNGRILNQDPKLYADIELLNPFVKESVEAYMNSVSRLSGIIESKDEQAFLRYFGAAAKHLGNFRIKAEQESDHLIEQMNGRGR